MSCTDKGLLVTVSEPEAYKSSLRYRENLELPVRQEIKKEGRLSKQK